MKPLILVVCAIVAVSFHCLGQTWQYVGGEESVKNRLGSSQIVVDPHGNLYTTTTSRSDSQMHIKRLTGNTWMEVCSKKQGGQLVVDNANNIYLNSFNNKGVGIVRWTNGTWQEIGNRDYVIPTTGTPCSYCVSPSGVIYLAANYSGPPGIGAWLLYRYSNGYWDLMDSIPTGNFVAISALTATEDGLLYAVIQRLDIVDSNIVVKIYDQQINHQLGSKVTGQLFGSGVAVDKTGNAYIAYIEQGKVSVGKFIGTESKITRISDSDTRCSLCELSIKIGADDLPYVMFREESPPIENIVVMKDDGSKWTCLPKLQVQMNNTYGANMALRGYGPVYVCYFDAKIYETNVFRLGPPQIAGPDTVCIDSSVGFINDYRTGDWTTDDTSIVTIDEIGDATGHAYGCAEIIYSASGYSSSKRICVTSCGGSSGLEIDEFTVTPNPFLEAIRIQVRCPQKEDIDVIVTDILGSTILKGSLPANSKAEFKLNCSSGLYFVTAICSHGKRTIKLAKQ